MTVGTAGPEARGVTAASALVWFIWLSCSVLACLYNYLYGPQLPYTDDWDVVPLITGTRPLSLEWLWAQHNEHRIPIAKIVFYLLYRLTDGDYRSVIYVNILLLSLISGLAIRAARRVRGTTRLTDIFYPLLFMSLAQNAFHWGFEFQFTSATFLVCLISTELLRTGTVSRVRSAVLLGLSLLCLPLTGGSGLLYTPFVAGWLILRVVIQYRTATGPAPRFGRDPGTMFVVAAAIVSVALCGLYFVGYRSVPHSWPSPDLKQFVSAFLHVLSAGIGSVADRRWPLAGLGAALLVVVSLTYAGTIAADRRRTVLERFRAANVAVFILAFLPLACGVAYGRGGLPWEATNHYSTLALPLLYWCYSAFLIGARPRLLALVQPALAVASVIAYLTLTAGVLKAGGGKADRTAKITHDLRSGVAPGLVVDRYIRDLFYIDTPDTRILVERGIADLRRAGFDRFGCPPSAPVGSLPTAARERCGAYAAPDGR